MQQYKWDTSVLVVVIKDVSGDAPEAEAKNLKRNPDLHHCLRG